MGSASDTGKNGGGDVKKNMMTLPLIYSKTHMTKSENRKLKELLGVKKKNRTVLAQIRGMIEETGGIDYARKKLDEFSSHALNAISIYPDSPVKQSLADLVAFNASRVK
jgi:octaprenyl-diphosphate synthase